MNGNEFIRQCTMGGPGLDGYAYQADVYCVDCGENIVRDLASGGVGAEMVASLRGTDDPNFGDSEQVPQPIFYGESDCEQHCAECGEYLYGESEGEE